LGGKGTRRRKGKERLYTIPDDTQLFLFLSLRDSETVGKKEKKLTGLPINYEEFTVNIVDWD
jgi:hypothetical protein